MTKELEATEHQVEILSDDLSKCSKALRLALEALEQWNTPLYKRATAITAIKEVLAQPEQEPCKTCGGTGEVETGIGMMVCDECHGTTYTTPPQPAQEPVAFDPLPRACNLAGVDYQTFLKIKAYMPVAPQRTWVGLTVGDTAELVKTLERGNFLVAIQNIEAKLKEKNCD